MPANWSPSVLLLFANIWQRAVNDGALRALAWGIHFHHNYNITDVSSILLLPKMKQSRLKKFICPTRSRTVTNIRHFYQKPTMLQRMPT